MQGDLAEHPPDIGVDDRREPRPQQPLVADGLVVEQGVGDAVAGESVDDEALLIRRDDLFGGGVEIKQPPVEPHDFLQEGELGVKAGCGDLPLELAELQDERLFALFDGEQRHRQEDRRDDRRDDRGQFQEPAHCSVSPAAARSAAARRCISGSGR